MRIVIFLPLVLTACGHPAENVGPDSSRGRYSGLGTYPAPRLWRELVVAKSNERTAAGVADDEQIVVVVDSHTGEIRQCGNLSGQCIAANPWKSLATIAPAKLLKHAEEVEDQTGTHNAAAAEPVKSGGN